MDDLETVISDRHVAVVKQVTVDYSIVVSVFAENAEYSDIDNVDIRTVIRMTDHVNHVFTVENGLMKV